MKFWNFQDFCSLFKLFLSFLFFFYFCTCLSFLLILFTSLKMKNTNLFSKYFMFSKFTRKIQKKSEIQTSFLFSSLIFLCHLTTSGNAFLIIFFYIPKKKCIDWTAAPQPMLCIPIFHCGQVKIGRNDRWEQESLHGDTESPYKQSLVMHPFFPQMKASWSMLIHSRFEQVLVEQKRWWSLQDILSAVCLWKVIWLVSSLFEPTIFSIPCGSGWRRWIIRTG